MKKSWKRWLAPAFVSAIAAMTAGTSLAAETVNVKVEHVKGGFLNVSYENDEGVRVFLPLGETVKVPFGKEMEVSAETFSYTDAEGKRVRTFLKAAAENGNSIYNGESMAGVVTADRDVILTASFGGKIETPVENSTWYDLRFVKNNQSYIGLQNPAAFREQIEIYDYSGEEKKLNFNEITNLEIRYQDYVPLSGWADETDVFTLDQSGILTSGTKSLEAGEYYVGIEFTYQGESCNASADIYVDEVMSVDYPYLAAYISNVERGTCTGRRAWYRSSGEVIGNADTDTLQSLWNQYQTRDYANQAVIANHEKYVGLGYYTSKIRDYTRYNLSDTAKSHINTGNYRINATLIPENYVPPVIEPLDAADITGATVKAGWNQQDGKWFYYETTEPESLKKSTWLPCKDDDGEQVWVGADGAMVVNGVVSDGTNKYLVDKNGHKVKNASEEKPVVLNGFEYITDETGVIVEVRMNLATPSNAAEALAQTETVLKNINAMSEEDKLRAADMLTEALKKSVKPADIKDEDAKKYEELYIKVYGAENIAVTDQVTNGILAAGLTSADFENGKVEIEYVSECMVASSSNAKARMTVALYVNGKERKSLLAPITVTAELPEEFIASYSNATYNFKVEKAEKADVDTEKGTITLKITSLGVFDIQAVKKSSSRPSGGGSSYSGGGRGAVKSTVKNGTRDGQWMRDEKGWWFKNSDGTWPANAWVYLAWNEAGNWYFFNGEGYMATGWILWNNDYYYLNPVSDGTCGSMFTGWHEIGGKWYYFFPTEGAPLGAMAHDTTTPDGYKVGSDGAWIR